MAELQRHQPILRNGAPNHNSFLGIARRFLVPHVGFDLVSRVGPVVSLFSFAVFGPKPRFLVCLKTSQQAFLARLEAPMSAPMTILPMIRQIARLYDVIVWR